MPFDLVQQVLELLLALLRCHVAQQRGEGVVAEACQLGSRREVPAQQVGQFGQQAIGIAEAEVGLQAGETVDADVGQAGALSGIDRALDRAIEQFQEMIAVVQAGDRVLAADFAQLLQLGVVALGANHHLYAGLAVVAGRREVHPRLEAAAVGANAAADQLRSALQGLIVLQETLEIALVAGGDQVDHRHAFQLVDILVAEQLEVGAVGVDMHAVMHVGDGIHRAFQEQVATLFGFTQRHLGGAPCATLFQVRQLPVGHQDQPLVLALRQGTLGAQRQGFGDGVDVVAVDQLDDRDVLGLTPNRADGVAGVEVLAAGRADQQIPGLQQRIGQILAGRDPVYARGLSGVAEQADQTLGFVLRVFKNEQTYGFSLDGHGSSFGTRPRGERRLEKEESPQSTATSRGSQNLRPRPPSGIVAL